MPLRGVWSGSASRSRHPFFASPKKGGKERRPDDLAGLWPVPCAPHSLRPGQNSPWRCQGSNMLSRTTPQAAAVLGECRRGWGSPWLALRVSCDCRAGRARHGDHVPPYNREMIFCRIPWGAHLPSVAPSIAPLAGEGAGYRPKAGRHRGRGFFADFLGKTRKSGGRGTHSRSNAA
jgi:hypothetical protein